jgi:hypothetical protein
MNLVYEKRHELEDLKRQILANRIQRPVALSGGRQEPRIEKDTHVI